MALEGGRYSGYDAHYLPDPGTPVTRVSEPANYRDGDDPPDRTVLCAELPCARDGELWRAGDERLAGLVRAALVDRGLPDPGPVRRVAVHRLPNVYPVYRVGYVTPFQALDAWAAGPPAPRSNGPGGGLGGDQTQKPPGPAQLRPSGPVRARQHPTRPGLGLGGGRRPRGRRRLRPRRLGRRPRGLRRPRGRGLTDRPDRLRRSESVARRPQADTTPSG